MQKELDMGIFNNVPYFTYAIVAVVIVVVVALVVRNIVCWYYKINRLVNQQEEIIATLKEIRDQRG